MKFDQRLLLIIKLINQYPSNKAYFFLFQYYCQLIIWKKNKLKLGRMQFLFEQVTLYTLLPTFHVKAVYLYQDESDDIENMFSKWQKYFIWKKDWVHLLSLLIIVYLSIVTFKTYLNNYFFLPIFTNNFFNEWYITLNRFLIQEMFCTSSIEINTKYSQFHKVFVDLLIDFCSYFNIFF